MAPYQFGLYAFSVANIHGYHGTNPTLCPYGKWYPNGFGIAILSNCMTSCSYFSSSFCLCTTTLNSFKPMQANFSSIIDESSISHDFSRSLKTIAFIFSFPWLNHIGAQSGWSFQHPSFVWSSLSQLEQCPLFFLFSSFAESATTLSFPWGFDLELLSSLSNLPHSSRYCSWTYTSFKYAGLKSNMVWQR